MDNEIEVMRILRIPPIGKLGVEVNGHRFERLADIPNAAARQRLMTAIGELIVFTDGYKTLVDAGVAPPLQAEKTTTTRNQDKASPEVEAQRAAFLASLERERDPLLVQANQTPDPAPGRFRQD